MLIILSGLPGVGKTAIARRLASEIQAVHIRIDSIEQAINNLNPDQSINDQGYRVGYAVAVDNLKLGHIVIADSVNPVALTRSAWLHVAEDAKVKSIEIEIKCSDAKEHQQRVKTRTSDIAGLKLPTWEEVMVREYHVWERKPLVIDTARSTLEQSVEIIRKAL